MDIMIKNYFIFNLMFDLMVVLNGGKKSGDQSLETINVWTRFYQTHQNEVKALRSAGGDYQRYNNVSSEEDED